MASSVGRGDLAPHPDKPLLYFSPSILARRRRLLKETRRMIAEDGLDGFSIRRLCQRAGVAQRTLYNAFQNKDRLIALAIREAYDEYSAYARTSTESASLAGLLSRTIAINRRNFRVRNYTKAVCALYFSANTKPDVWETLQEMSLLGTHRWLERRKAELQPWVDVNHLAEVMANVLYATINDWALGRLEDQEYLPRLAENILLLVIGSAKGELAEEATRFLETIQRTGDVNSIITPVSDPPRRPDEPAEDIAEDAAPKRTRASKTVTDEQ
ncbi:TetR/AcrR family transcriptional regulator [Novosphingobium sp. KCTC 2891]|uniref:TetR/AcrR family transcriptional regulator n=1 Tax=Novosphingobium sp. KCTC 2891 TaxID=2989730 RepID=UPI0022237CB2|nr:TetR/AcrR family transcriptional regulator [Novosphingobium sp. KCTC 2891]MCW1382943.1 TetR/AcrR family transcriptional regulator [Novosphingobium sp. KCTC 2891]